jgi:eukaryotic-like serine/threonine-protein kinase
MDIQWLGPYKIVGKLGRGGMGTVYKAVHRETGESAAVKLLSPTLAEEQGFRVRFEAEIETLRMLNHPNIVRLFGFGQQEGDLFYAMELVEGNSLEEELRLGRRFDWREVVRLGIEICRALRHAHDRGIIHRDIKPGNLLLATDGGVKLSDFGIARLFGYSHLTAAGNVVGTAEYMPPEQAEGLAVDARSDLYSLGALLYALLTRRPVFRGKSLPEVLHKQRFEQPEPLRTHAADVPEELENIVAQLLEKDPARRIPNASILGRRLEAVLPPLHVGGETVEAGSDWFGDHERTPTAELATLLPIPEDHAVAPTIDRPATADQPAPPPARQATAADPQVTSSPAVAAKETDPDESATSVASPRNHFVVVGEDELDPLRADEPRPVFSWQTGLLVAALVLLALGVRWSLQPPSADTLYSRIAARMNTGSSGAKTRSEIGEVRDTITDFLGRYANDPRGGRVREWDQDLEERQEQSDFELRITLRDTPLSPMEQMYWEAAGNARLNPTKAMTELQAMIDLYEQPGEEKGKTKRCLAAARLRLRDLRVEVKKLAGDQCAVLRERLDAADSLRAREPERARAMYRAVVALYGDKPWAAEPVRRARKALDDMPARKP